MFGCDPGDVVDLFADEFDVVCIRRFGCFVVFGECIALNAGVGVNIVEDWVEKEVEQWWT